jgi:hypothetical protein
MTAIVGAPSFGTTSFGRRTIRIATSGGRTVGAAAVGRETAKITAIRWSAVAATFFRSRISHPLARAGTTRKAAELSWAIAPESARSTSFTRRFWPSLGAQLLNLAIQARHFVAQLFQQADNFPRTGTAAET